MASTCLALLFAVHAVFGIQQEITFYTELDQGGDSVTFRSTIPDLSSYSHVTNNTKSFRVAGYWLSYKLKDFEGDVLGYGQYEEKAILGSYYNFLGSISFSSIRHLAAADTSTQALSLYEGANWDGREHFITSLASNNFPFTPLTYASSGKSVWTFFEGSNFDGNSTCIKLLPYNLNGGSIYQTVRSAVKGCGAEAQLNIASYKLNKF